MSLAKYLREGKMELFYWEIKSSIEIKLKTVFCWLISESQLKKRRKFGIRKRSVIVFIVSTSKKAAKLCSKGLRFGGALKVVEKY